MKMLSRKILYCCMGVCSMIALSNSAECKELVITPSSVEYRASGGVDETELRRLLPELERKEIRVEHLSKTIQMVNEGRSMKLKVQFQPEDYNVPITVDTRISVLPVLQTPTQDVPLLLITVPM